MFFFLIQLTSASCLVCWFLPFLESQLIFPILEMVWHYIIQICRSCSRFISLLSFWRHPDIGMVGRREEIVEQMILMMKVPKLAPEGSIKFQEFSRNSSPDLATVDVLDSDFWEGKDKISKKKKKKWHGSESKHGIWVWRTGHDQFWGLHQDSRRRKMCILPLLDVLANKVKATRRLGELLAGKLPAGTFPVKVEILARFIFTNSLPHSLWTISFLHHALFLHYYYCIFSRAFWASNFASYETSLRFANLCDIWSLVYGFNFCISLLYNIFRANEKLV